MCLVPDQIRGVALALERSIDDWLNVLRRFLHCSRGCNGGRGGDRSTVSPGFVVLTLVGMVSHWGSEMSLVFRPSPITRWIVSGYAMFLSKSSADILEVLYTFSRYCLTQGSFFPVFGRDLSVGNLDVSDGQFDFVVSGLLLVRGS